MEKRNEFAFENVEAARNTISAAATSIPYPRNDAEALRRICRELAAVVYLADNSEAAPALCGELGVDPFATVSFAASRILAAANSVPFADPISTFAERFPQMAHSLGDEFRVKFMGNIGDSFSDPAPRVEYMTRAEMLVRFARRYPVVAEVDFEGMTLYFEENEIEIHLEKVAHPLTTPRTLKLHGMNCGGGGFDESFRRPPQYDTQRAAAAGIPGAPDCPRPLVMTGDVVVHTVDGDSYTGKVVGVCGKRVRIQDVDGFNDLLEVGIETISSVNGKIVER